MVSNCQCLWYNVERTDCDWLDFDAENWNGIYVDENCGAEGGKGRSGGLDEN